MICKGEGKIWKVVSKTDRGKKNETTFQPLRDFSNKKKGGRKRQITDLLDGERERSESTLVVPMVSARRIFWIFISWIVYVTRRLQLFDYFFHREGDTVEKKATQKIPKNQWLLLLLYTTWVQWFRCRLGPPSKKKAQLTETWLCESKEA